jgi:hypothetical protein
MSNSTPNNKDPHTLPSKLSSERIDRMSALMQATGKFTREEAVGKRIGEKEAGIMEGGEISFSRKNGESLSRRPCK